MKKIRCPRKLKKKLKKEDYCVYFQWRVDHDTAFAYKLAEIWADIIH